MIWLNGQLFESDTALFNSSNRAFRYGDGAFESIRVIDGGVPLIRLHLKRLKAGLKALGMESQANLEKMLLDAILDLKLLSGHFRLRMQVFRAGAGRYLPDTNQMAVLIEAEPIAASTHLWLDDQYYSVGASAAVLPAHRLMHYKLSGTSIFYVHTAVHSLGYANVDLITNPDFYPIDTNLGNIFWKIDEEWFTVPEEEYFIKGVFRAFILQRAAQKNIKINFDLLSQDYNPFIDSFFICNAIRGIIPVDQINFEALDIQPVLDFHKALFL